MNFIILGDKFQRRMKSKGCVGLLKVKNEFLIDYQYRIIKNHQPDAEIIYVYGFDGKRFSNYIHKNIDRFPDLITIYNPRYQTTNSAYSLNLANQYLNKGCCILFGDHLLQKKTLTQIIADEYSKIFINKKQKNPLGCVINNNKIENIAYDLENYLLDMYYVSNIHSQKLKEILSMSNNQNCFIFEIINKLIDKNHTIQPIFVNHNTPKLYSKA